MPTDSSCSGFTDRDFGWGLVTLITLRQLEEKDAELMCEWMHDPEINQWFERDMFSLSVEDCKTFCRNQRLSEEIIDGQSRHYAVVNDVDDLYLGTISLKNLNLKNRSAGYAISLRKAAQGTGAAYSATWLLFKLAFEELHLNRIALTVLSDNLRAVNFYLKCGFQYEGEFRDHVCIHNRFKNHLLFSILARDYRKLSFK